jgi:GNAT superfamily N-acetyltransferase
MIEKIKVRSFSIDDSLQVLELLQEISRYQLLPIEAQNFAKEFIRQSGAQGFVALEGDVVIGFGSIVTYMRVRGGRCGVIEDVVVAKNFRRKGIASMIIAELMKFAQMGGCFKVSLESNNASRSIYKASGFDDGGQTMKHLFVK